MRHRRKTSNSGQWFQIGLDLDLSPDPKVKPCARRVFALLTKHIEWRPSVAPMQSRFYLCNIVSMFHPNYPAWSHRPPRAHSDASLSLGSMMVVSSWFFLRAWSRVQGEFTDVIPFLNLHSCATANCAAHNFGYVVSACLYFTGTHSLCFYFLHSYPHAATNS